MAHHPDDASRQSPPGAWPSPEQELRALLEGAVQLAEASTEDAVAQRALESCVGALGARGGAVRFLQGGHLHLIHHSGWPGASVEVSRILRPRFAALPLDGESVAAWVARTGEVRALQTLEEVTGLAEGAVASEDGSYVYLPIAVGGRTTGVIGVGFAGYRSFDPLTIQALAGFGQHTALALERVRLAHAQSESLRTLAVAAARAEALQRAARAFARAGNEREVLQAAVDVVFDALLPEGVSALMVQNGALHAMASRSERAAAPAERTATALSLDASHPWAVAVRRAGSMWFGGGASPRPQATDGSLRPGRSGGAVALVVDGVAIGALAISYAHPRVVPGPDRELFGSLAVLCAETLRRVRSQEGKRHADAHALALHRVTEAFSRAVTLDDVLIAAIEVIGDALGTRLSAAYAVEDGRTRGYRLEAGVLQRLEPTKPMVARPSLVRALFPDSGVQLTEDIAEVVELFAAPAAQGWADTMGLHLPLWVDNVVVGGIGCAFPAGHRPSAAERSLATSLAASCAEAVRRASLYEVERRSARRHAALRAASEAFAKAATPPEVLEVVRQVLPELLGAMTVTIAQQGETELRLVGEAHPVEGRSAATMIAGMCGRGGVEPADWFPLGGVRWLDVALGLARDVAPEEVPDEPAGAATATGQGACAGAVVLLRGPAVLGVVGIDFVRPRTINVSDRNVLHDLVAMCVDALRRAHASQEQQRAAARAMVLHRVTGALSVATTMDEVIKVAVGELHEALGATSTAAGLVRGDNLELVDIRGRVARDRDALAVVPLERDWPPSTVLRSGRSLWHDEERPMAEHDRAGGLRSAAVLPFLVDREPLGVLSIGFLDSPRVAQADREVIESVVSLCSEALRRARLFEQEHAAAERYERLFAGYERLFARHPQPMAVLDEDSQEILAANEVLLGTFGYTSEELAAVRPDALLHPSERVVLRQRMAHLDDAPLDAHFYPLVRVQRRDGSEFIADLTTSAVDFGGRTARLVLVNDQTAWVETEQERQRLQERVVTVAEEERRRIAIDLHDGAVQELSVVAMRLGALRRQVQRGELPTPERLQALEDGAHTTVNLLRGLMQQLYPTNFGERSLGELIDEVVPSGPWAPSLSVTIEDRLDRPVPLLAKAALYRVVVEALTNIHKHAGARVATVELSCRGEEFCACIVDDGIGIGNGTAVRSGHFGLTSMRDRISLLGGRCSIENAPSGGTMVRACVPFPPVAVLDLPARMHGVAAPGHSTVSGSR